MSVAQVLKLIDYVKIKEMCSMYYGQFSCKERFLTSVIRRYPSSKWVAHTPIPSSIFTHRSQWTLLSASHIRNVKDDPEVNLNSAIQTNYLMISNNNIFPQEANSFFSRRGAYFIRAKLCIAQLPTENLLDSKSPGCSNNSCSPLRSLSQH